APGEAAAGVVEEGLQLAARGTRGGRRVLGRAEARGCRRSHERRGLDSKLVPDELAELLERRAARRLDALVEKERGELLAARGRDPARTATDAAGRPEARFRQHDAHARSADCKQQEPQRPA